MSNVPRSENEKEKKKKNPGGKVSSKSAAPKQPPKSPSKQPSAIFKTSAKIPAKQPSKQAPKTISVASISAASKLPPVTARSSPVRQPSKDASSPSAKGIATAAAGKQPVKSTKSKEPVSIPEEINEASTEQIIVKTHFMENEIHIMNSQVMQLRHDIETMEAKKKLNQERIKVNKHLPFLVSNIIELLDLNKSIEPDHEGANIDAEATKAKCVIIKTSTRATYFLPNVGLLDPDTLKPGDLIGVNKDSHVLLEKLPAEYDSRIKAMEVDERPKEKFTDVGGLDKQIQELTEVVIWPLKMKDRFKKLGIVPPKGVLMYGPPGTGKTLLARAVAAQTKSTFLKLAGPQLVQMFIGDGAKLVRDCFALAKEKAPSIIFIDEIDAVGGKRFNSDKAGDREVHRTMLELLNQLDGFQPNDDIKVIAATNRVDVLDPALVRSGRLDRKIELPLPNEGARLRVIQIHSRKMNLHNGVRFEELSRCMDDFNSAQCKAVCTEAGMSALRRNATLITHEDFVDGILEVQAKKKSNLNYYA